MTGHVDNVEIRKLKREYPRALSRTCALPWCNERMSVTLTASETDFKAAAYCSTEHQDFANRRRKKLRASLARIDVLLSSTDELAEVNRAAKDAEEPTLTRAELERVARRLRWELDGMPPARVAKRTRPST